MTGVQGGDVRLGDVRVLRELRLQPVNRCLALAAVHPVDEAQRPHVLRAQRFLVREAELLDRLDREPGHVNLDQPVVLQAVVLERVLVVSGLGQVAVRERTRVRDDNAVRLDVLEVRDERGGVHRDQDVELVARGHDLAGAEIDLECRDTEGRAGGRTDFGGEVREGGQVVAGDRRRHGELAAGKLHAVTGVAGEPHDRGFNFLAVFFRPIYGRCFRHRVFPSLIRPLVRPVVPLQSRKFFRMCARRVARRYIHPAAGPFQAQIGVPPAELRCFAG